MGDVRRVAHRPRAAKSFVCAEAVMMGSGVWGRVPDLTFESSPRCVILREHISKQVK